LPGTGEQGSDLNLLLHGGQLAWQISNGYKPSTVVNGKTLKYIVCTPQGPANSWGWNSPQISNFIDQLEKLYRVDPTRVYLSGLSAGSWGIQQAFTDANIAKKVTAVCLISSGSTVDAGCINIAKGKIPTWIICGDQDAHIVDAQYEQKNLINNGLTPAYTVLPGVGHSAWNQAYDPTWKVNGLNLYDWFGQFGGPVHYQEPNKKPRSCN